jgi:hypothetical protein
MMTREQEFHEFLKIVGVGVAVVIGGLVLIQLLGAL